MANVKISALPTTATTTLNDYFVVDDALLTTTSKIQLKNFAGLTNINGNNAIQSADYLTSLGTTATTESAIAIGNGAEATSPYSIAIGYGAYNPNRDGARDYYIVIGTNARAVQGATAIGKDSFAAGANATSFGINAETFGNAAFALGNTTLAASTDGVAIGSNSRDESNTAGLAIGQNAIVKSDKGVAIGSFAEVSGATGGTALGQVAAARALRATAIGYGATAEHESAVCLGNITSVFSATTHNTNDYTYGVTSFNVVNGGQVGGNIDVDCSLGTIYKFEMTANTTPNFINFRDGQQIWFIVLNTTYNVPTATIAGGGDVFAKNGTISPSNNGWTKYMGTFISGDLWLDEELGFSAV